MEYLLTGAEMSACDARTSDPAVIGIPSLVLMERAALSLADGAEAYLKKKYGAPESRCGRGTVLAAAGRGNNGADALAAGRILLDRGYRVVFCRLSGEVSADSSFAVQENILSHYGRAVRLFPELQEAPDAAGAAPDVILDGLFGTGLSRPLKGEAAACVDWINRMRDLYGSYVVAVDIPSGISSDDGRVMGCAVRCDETRTFAFYKRGHFLYPGASYAGPVHLAQIGITERAFAGRPGMFTFLHKRPADLLPPRDPAGNKGTFGKVLIVAGRRNMCGAALLAARACMAAGAGMVKVFTHEANRVIVQQSLPEALLETFSEQDPPAQAAQKLRACLDWADVAAAGPAMGTDESAAALLEEVLTYAAGPDAGAGGKKGLRGLVLDADAVRILADQPQLQDLLAGRPADLPCILTPHLAEFSALAHASLQTCREERIELVQDRADRLHSTIVCKDARTLIARPSSAGDGPGPLYLNCTGNSGMATAGSGDVLTGITAALLGLFASSKTAAAGKAGKAGNVTADDGEALKGKRGMEAGTGRTSSLFPWPEDPRSGFEAACCAVCLHGLAGDAAAERCGAAGMTAGDLAESLRRADFWQQGSN